MTYDEQRNIVACLDSLTAFDEVFVVDSNSADDTVALAEAKGARVVAFTWNGRYPKKKQWCLDNLPFRNDWVLYVDADERMTPELADEITALMAIGPARAGYLVRYRYAYAGRLLRFGHQIYKLVLFDRRRGRFLDYDDLDAVNMWEVEGHYQPQIDGPVNVLRHRMLHFDHDDLFHYFERHNRYSDWEAVLLDKGAISDAREAQPGLRRYLKPLWHRLPLRGLIAFLHSYVLLLGFLDGRAGLDFAIARGFYYWQVQLKLRERRRRRATF
jgi:glycosyltransferase involved in cell wall biosynthesis